MGQEAEKEINFESLRAIAEEAIENKDFSAIERIEDENQLEYIQKFVDVKLSNIAVNISIPSFFLSAFGVVFGIIAIGLTLFLVGISIDGVIKITYPVAGIIIVLYGGWLFRELYKYKGKFEKAGKDIEFMHKIILRIEEKLIRKALAEKAIKDEVRR